jgi:hypothetical protein
MWERGVEVRGKQIKLWEVFLAIAVVIGFVAAVMTIFSVNHWWPWESTNQVVINQVLTKKQESAALPKCASQHLRYGYASPLSVNAVVQDPVTKCFTSEVTNVEPGSKLVFAVRYANGSDGTQRGVVVRANLAPKLTLVPHSTYLVNGSHGHWTLITSDYVTQGGLAIGSYGPRAAGYVKFSVTVPFDRDLECGYTEFRTLLVARAEGANEFYNTNSVRVLRIC